MSIPEIYRDRSVFQEYLEGNNCRLYISNESKRRILKIHKPTSRHLREITGTISEKVVKLQTIFNILKKYYGHYLVDTTYFTYDRTIAEIKLFISGTPVDQFESTSEVILAAHELKFHLQDLWQEFKNDPDLSTIDHQTLVNLGSPDLVFSNFIFSLPDSYHIIDW